MSKDTLILSGLAGVIGNIPKEIITWVFYFSGLIKYTFIHFCAGIVINPATYVKDPISLLTGLIIDFSIAAFFGLAMYVALRRTGTDYWILKGLGFGVFVFLICYGILRPLFSIRIESPPLIALMYLIPNLMYAVTTCWFLKRYGIYKVF